MRNGWPVGLFGALAILAVAEGYLASRKDELSSIYSIEWRRNSQAIRKHAAGLGVLCFGTSLSRMGLSPRVLEESLSLPAYNFAASGAQPYSCYLSLRRAFARGAKPRAIVVDFAWTTLGMPDSFNEVGLAEIASPAELVTFATSTRDGSLLGRMLLSWLLPSYRGRPEIRTNIAAAVAGLEPNRNPERFLQARNAEANRGAFHQGPIDYDGAIDPSNSVMFPADWRPTASSRRYIDAFLRLAGSHDVPVFWVIPPLAPGAEEVWATSGTKTRYFDLIGAIAERHPNVTVLDATGASYPVAVFNDPVHLNRDGAVVFTKDVAAAMKDRLATDGGTIVQRLVLPDYRPDPAPGRVEDSRATFARLRAAMDSARH